LPTIHFHKHHTVGNNAVEILTTLNPRSTDRGTQCCGSKGIIDPDHPKITLLSNPVRRHLKPERLAPGGFEAEAMSKENKSVQKKKMGRGNLWIAAKSFGGVRTKSDSRWVVGIQK